MGFPDSLQFSGAPSGMTMLILNASLRASPKLSKHQWQIVGTTCGVHVMTSLLSIVPVQRPRFSWLHNSDFVSVSKQGSKNENTRVACSMKKHLLTSFQQS